MKTSELARLLLVILFSFHSNSFGSGVFTLKGKLKGFTADIYLVSTANLTYSIKKTNLSDFQLAQLKTKRSGQEVELVISTEAVSAVE